MGQEVYIHNCRKNTHPQWEGPLRAQEIQASEEVWLKTMQLRAFDKDIVALSNGRTLEKSSRIRDLHPFLDKRGILRIKTRLDNASTSDDVKFPALLPPDQHCAHLIVNDMHRRILHGGVSATLAELRERFWLLRGRQCVKKVISKCVVCARFRLNAISTPTAPLPKDRVSQSQPFQVSGVDFAGPVFVKGDFTEKAYIVVFTCAVVRAVHLELCSDMSVNSFMLAFRRFVARRGIQSVLYSNNALTFKAASRELKSIYEILRDAQVQNFCAMSHITWKFIAERASWWGGFWERMIRMVKGCLRRTLGKGSFNFEQLSTVLAEVEAVVNSRPLTYVSADAKELEVLTPAHFLALGRLTVLPHHEVHVTAMKRTDTLRLWKDRQHRLTAFWNRWYKDYLLALRSAHFSKDKGKEITLSVDDIVLIRDDKVPITFWKMGRISKVYEGTDGHVRACRIRLANSAEITRPIQLLTPLELYK